MTAHHPIPTDTWNEAAAVLTNFVLIEADAMARLVGFGWQTTPDAPTDFADLCEAYTHSERTGEPLPVSSDHSHSTIYLTPEANVAFRFWHDVTHVRLDQCFDPYDELEVAKAQLQILKAKGWGPDTWVYRLLRSDTLGQTIFGARTGTFPVGQAAFARADLEKGLEHAVEEHS